jgi:hypothetical protein
VSGHHLPSPILRRNASGQGVIDFFTWGTNLEVRYSMRKGAPGNDAKEVGLEKPAEETYDYRALSVKRSKRWEVQRYLRDSA